MFSNRLLCSPKDYCVSEQKLSCVLPLWATVKVELLATKETMRFFNELEVGGRARHAGKLFQID